MKRFPALHTISSIFKVLAWIIGVLAIIFSVVTMVGMSEYSDGGGFGMGLLILIAGAFYAIMIYALSEGIMVILAIEENTRGLSEAAKKTPLIKTESE